MLFPFHDDNPTVRMPIITVGLVVVNVVAFVQMTRLSDTQQQVAAYRRGFVPARIAQLRNPRPIVVPVERIVRHPFNGRPIRVREQMQLDPAPRKIVASLFTCMFMHGSWMHLLGNMWFLWVFGNNVEDRLGHVAYLCVYLLGGIIASGCHWLTNPGSLVPVIGASGAVATVLGAYAITWPWARIHTLVFLFIFITIIDLPALLVLGVWFVGQLLSGTQALKNELAAGVAWWAHVGGFLAGLVLMPLLCSVIRPPRHRGRNRFETQEEVA